MIRAFRQGVLCLLATAPVGIVACGEPEGAASARQPASSAADSVLAVVAATVDSLAAAADSLDEILRPLPLMTPVQEAALRRYPNAQHVARARALGVRPASEAELNTVRAAGGLVPLAVSSEFWVVRRIAPSGRLVTADTEALLREIGRRFQARIGELGLPPLRYEITSALRTAAAQAALRRTNPNAAAGTSAHEFGTTVDILYSAYAAPAESAPIRGGTLEPALQRMAEVMVERVAGRRSRELQRILGEVLRELQAEGAVLVTLERQQPVYHITVGRRFEG
ncbi:MAG: DUF5715 family protein [Longimicrobiales bacterium]